MFEFIESHTDVEFAVDVVLSTPDLNDVDFGKGDKVTGDVARVWMEKLEKAENDLQSR